MNTTHDIEDLILRYFTGKISPEESKRLKHWLKDSQNRQHFKEVQGIWEFSDTSVDSQMFDTEKGWARFSTWMVMQKKGFGYFPKSTFNALWQVAATVVIILSVSFLLYHYSKPSYQTSTREFSSVVQKLPQEVVLEFDDGQTHRLSTELDTKLKTSDGIQIRKKSGHTLVYQPSEQKSLKIHYNRIVIPHGKRFHLQLSDGSQVWLNSGSSLRYPTRFTGTTRKVELKGEGFFQVHKDKKHPFIVNSSGVNVKVLGTSFNVRSYGDHNKVQTTLVEGSVCMYPKGVSSKKAVLLKPNQQGSFAPQDGSIRVQSVDVTRYTAWKDGDLLFYSEPFESLKKRLERWYGVTIKNFVPGLEDERFSGRFNKESVEQALGVIQATYPFQFVRKGDTIIITK